MERGKAPEKFDISAPNYTGKILWDVSHPDYKKPCRVRAPVRDNTNGALCIELAAEFWGRRWQDITFYPYCDVRRAYNTEPQL